jgi:predicted NBD/HSP70 family sugar kinase
MNYYAGIDIGGTSVKLGIMDEQGNVVWEGSVPTIPGDAPLMADKITAALQESGYAFQAAGISCAGRVFKDTGRVIASNLRWVNVPFVAMMETRLNCPIAIDNDVAGAMYGEWSLGVCRHVNYVAYVILGTGVGGAFIIDGKPFRGYNNTGGEVGHMITHADGLPCACGGHGCFEQYASARALSRMAGGITTQEVFRLAAEGDAHMLQVLDEYLRFVRRVTTVLFPVSHIAHAHAKLGRIHTQCVAKSDRIKVFLLLLIDDHGYLIDGLIRYQQLSIAVVYQSACRIDGLAQLSIVVGFFFGGLINNLQREEAYNIHHYNHNSYARYYMSAIVILIVNHCAILAYHIPIILSA